MVSVIYSTQNTLNIQLKKHTESAVPPPVNDQFKKQAILRLCEFVYHNFIQFWHSTEALSLPSNLHQITVFTEVNLFSWIF